MAHEHGHDHGELHYEGAEVSDDALEAIRATHARLAEALSLTRRWRELDEAQRKAAVEAQSAVERVEAWMPGFHATGDRCAVCGAATSRLFADRFKEGELPYAAFVRGLPVHATPSCLEAFGKTPRDLSMRGLDRARRELMRDLERPLPRLVQFFRHDVLAHPPFGLEDWGNSVADAQPGGLDRAAMRDIERLLRWVHARLFHG